MVGSVNDTSVVVLWNAVVIPGHDIDNYTVIYSLVTSKRQEEGDEMMTVVPGNVTFIVITGLNLSFNYQFQVFAIVIVDDQSLKGNRSNNVTLFNGKLYVQEKFVQLSLSFALYDT